MFKKDLISLNDLFKNYIFRIPDYQRGYSWTKAQLIDFWEDLINLDIDKTHYTGMLTIKLLDKKSIKDSPEWIDESWLFADSDYEVCYVIDGQQRLTTSIILINEILSQVKDDENFSAFNRTYDDFYRHFIVETKKGMESRKCYKFGYMSDENSFNFLKTDIFGHIGKESIESYYTHNMIYAKSYFAEKLLEYKKQGKSFETLFRKLIGYFKFNVFPIDDDFEDVIAFETMNNRGKRLSTLEILKNRLIYIASIIEMSDGDRSSLRKKINGAWSEIYRQLGKDPEHLLDDDEYLRDHWILYYHEYSSRKGYDFASRLLNDHFSLRFTEGYISVEEPDDNSMPDITAESQEAEYDTESGEPDFQDVKPVKKHGLTNVDIEKYVESIESLAKYWFYIHEPSEKKDIIDERIVFEINRINRAGVNYFKPLLMACLSSNEEMDTKVELLKKIEKFIFIYFRLSQNNAGSYKNKFYTLSSNLYWGEKTIADIIDELERLIAENKSIALDRFESYIEGRFKNGDGYYNWTRPLKYLLFEYEQHLAGNRDSKIIWNEFVKNKRDHSVSIEHIYPQNPGSGWPDWSIDYSDDQIKRLTNSLGNLLALETRINSSLQNVSYEDKLDGNGRPGNGYRNGSHSEVDVANNYSEWTPESIKTRGIDMIDFMLEHWELGSIDKSRKLRLLGLSFIKEIKESTATED